MNMTAIKSALAVLLFAAGVVQAAETRRVDELMHKSGMWAQLGQSQAQIKAGAREAQEQAKAGKGGHKFEDDDFARLLAAMDAAYAPDKLRAAMSREFEARMTAQDEAEVLTWLSSELGTRLTRLEEQSGELEQSMATTREAPAFFATVSKARVAKFERMVKAIKMGEATASMVINMTTAIGFGMGLANPRVDAAAVAQSIRDRMEPERAKMAAEFDQRALQSFAYVYRGVSDADVEKYVAFAESPAGRRYHEASVQGMDNVLARAGIQMGREFDILTREPARRS